MARTAQWMSLLLCQVSQYINDCVYCVPNSVLVTTSFRDIGVKAIENLMEKRGKFDYILLETRYESQNSQDHTANIN